MLLPAGGGDVDKYIGYIGTGATILDNINTGMEATNSILRETGNGGRAVAILGSTTRVIGKAGYVAAAAGTYLDYKDMRSGQISATRFSYRTVGTGVGIGIGAWIGAIPGTCVGGLFYVGEKCWDGITLFIDKVSEAAGKIQSGEWIPGAN